MTNTPHYGWAMPTDGGDENTWGTKAITLWGQQDTDLYAVSVAADAAQSTADAIDTRVDTLETKTPVGNAGWATGKYYWGATCEGLETEDTVGLTSGRRYLVPFDHTGSFSGIGFCPYAGPANTYTLEILDSTAAGAPSTVLATVDYTGPFTGSPVVASITPVTLYRPAWISIKGSTTNSAIRLRGTTGVAPRWRLGTASQAVTAYTDVVVCIYGTSVPYTAIALGTKNWAPALCLQST